MVEDKSFVEEIDTRSKAINSLIFGISSFSIPFFGLLFAIVSIIYGRKAIKYISLQNSSGKGMALTGIIISILNIILTLIGIIGFIVILLWFNAAIIHTI